MNDKVKSSQMVLCPHCGSTGGYYKVGKVRGYYSSWYNFDGTVGDNTEMYSGIIHGDEQKSCFCQQCHKKLKLQSNEQ